MRRSAEPPEPPADLPPNDQEAEQQVLGSLLIDDRAIAQVAGMLAPADFFIGVHGKVFAAMVAVHERDRPTDISVVRAELEQRGDLEAVGGPAKLVELINAAPTAVNLLHYVALVLDKAIRRRLLRAAAEVARIAYDAPTPEEAMSQVQRTILGAAARPGAGRPTCPQWPRPCGTRSAPSPTGRPRARSSPPGCPPASRTWTTARAGWPAGSWCSWPPGPRWASPPWRRRSPPTPAGPGTGCSSSPWRWGPRRSWGGCCGSRPGSTATWPCGGCCPATSWGASAGPWATCRASGCGSTTRRRCR